MVCKIFFLRRKRLAEKREEGEEEERAQPIAKHYAFHANEIKELKQNFNVQTFSLLELYVGKAESSILVVFTCPGEATNIYFYYSHVLQ